MDPLGDTFAAARATAARRPPPAARRPMRRRRQPRRRAAPAPPGPRPFAPLVSEAILAIPLGTQELVRQSLDLLTRRDAGLRGASFYIGFMLLVTCAAGRDHPGPRPDRARPGRHVRPATPPTPARYDEVERVARLDLPRRSPAFLGYLAAATEARSLATAVIGGRVEGRPLRLRESIAVARAPVLDRARGARSSSGWSRRSRASSPRRSCCWWSATGDELSFGVSLVVSVVVGAPFVYVPAGHHPGRGGSDGGDRAARSGSSACASAWPSW